MAETEIAQPLPSPEHAIPEKKEQKPVEKPAHPQEAPAETGSSGQ